MLATRNHLLVALLFCSAVSPALQADEGTKANPALWEISDEDTTISLFGTMHVMRPEVDWFHGEVKAAFDDADQLIIETLQPDQAEQQRILMKVAVDQSGQTLRSKLEPDDRLRYEQTLQSLGLQSNSFDALDPWMAFMTLSIIPMMQAGYQLETGVDNVLTLAANVSAKPVIGLVDFEVHLGYLDSLSESLQLDMLNGTVQEINQIRMLTHQLASLWSTGRIDELGQLMSSMMPGYADSEEFIETIITNRNKIWADWVEARMETPGHVFLAVGAGHFAGEQNLRELLEKRGFDVKRVQTETALAE